MPDEMVVPRRFRLPHSLFEPAEAWLTGAVDTPVPARSASTVMLVRDAPAGGVEVFTMRRVSTMAFAADVTVFPGGGVDGRDADRDLPWAGPSPGRWAELLGCEEDLARELVVAAAREVFEECGVLLAGVDDDDVVADLSDPGWDLERDRLLSRELSFAELLIGRGLVLRSDLVQIRARWVTPEFEPRRYDALFFAARLPHGQTPDDRSSEAVTAEWGRPADLLAAEAAEDITLMPPTRIMLEDLAASADVAAVMAPGGTPRTVMPRLVRDEQGRPALEALVPGREEGT